MKHTFSCIDGHTCGNPCRVVTQGAPELAGSSIADYRTDFIAHHDWIRKALMFEPRGHDAMSGVILYPPFRDDCDIGFLFIEVSGCLPMCGHDTIGACTYILEEELVVPQRAGHLSIETPAGRVDATYKIRDGYVEEVRLFNVSSYLHKADVMIDVEGLGPLTVDVSYGGNFYAIVEPQENYSGLQALSASDLVQISPAVRRAAQSAVAPVHPEDPRIAGVSHVMWCDEPLDTKADGRNAVFYGDKGIDRSPCGTGTSARMAQLFARGALTVGDHFVHESLIGTLYNCKVESAATIGVHAGINPSIAGWAMITGHNEIIVNERDPFAHGFQLR